MASADVSLVPSTAEQVWNSLKQSNADLAESFRALSKLASEDADVYEKEVQKLSTTTSNEVRRLSLSCSSLHSSLSARSQWSSSSPHFATATKHILVRCSRRA